ncbi:MAG: alpha/beta hydrolase [Gammaproteobacteria bacterium]|nr:alpha/beta hydrolase [Gammaproteobacteria bacterium]
MKVTTNGINLNVRAAGSGDKVLVFLHFWGASSREWSGVTEGLSGKYRCIAIDARGSGDSDAPSTGYAIKDLADDVQGVIAALKLKSYVLVGHSMGGKTAQALAARRPEGLRGVALVASSLAGPLQIGQEQREQMKRAYSSQDSINFVIDNVLTGSPISKKDRENFVTDALRLSPGMREGWIEVGTRDDFSKEVANINVPVAVIAGEIDKVDPLEVVKSHVLPSFKDPEVHVLKNKGHLLPMEAPIEVAEILGRFAAKLLA